MIADLKPYAEYKESGLPWLGQMPGHWTVETLRRFLKAVDGIKIGPFGSQLKLAHMSQSGFKVYGQANVIAGDIKRGSNYVDEAKFEQLRECDVRPGDLLVTMMGTSGRCMVVPEDAAAGLMDSHLLRVRLRANRIGPVFTALTIDQAPYVKQQFEIAGKGSIMHGLNSGMVKNLALVIPPPSEQAAIVRFLDWANGRLERAIRAKRKVIALLNEQKQAIIHRAVIRGLDPSVPLKPSGIPWLGDIPEHWEVRRVASFAEKVTNGWVGPTREILRETGVPYLQSLHVKGGEIRFKKRYFVDALWLEKHQKIQLRAGDVVVVQTGDVGQVAHIPIEFDGAGCHALIIIGTKLSVIGGSYLSMVLNCWYGQVALKLIETGALLPHLNCGYVRDVQIPVPPLPEQLAIEVHLGSTLEPVSGAISRLEREIELIREYRIRLVADAVTGKLDVREAAARLPNEPPPDTAEDAMASGDETEAADEEAAV